MTSCKMWKLLEINARSIFVLGNGMFVLEVGWFQSNFELHPIVCWLIYIQIHNCSSLKNSIIHRRGFCRWHDAGTYDAKTKTGGPNGSIRNEYNHEVNRGLKIAIDLCGELTCFCFNILAVTLFRVRHD